MTRGLTHEELAALPWQRRRRSLIGGCIGNLIEGYDWLVYSTFSLYFAHAFFPHGSRTAQLLNAAAIFSVGYVMRPVGAIALGWLADRRGRKGALTSSVFMMCIGSLMIAVTPGYATFGIGAPITLVLAVPILHALAAAQGPASALLLLLVLAGLAITSGFTAVSAVVKAELFPPEVRALGIGVPYAVVIALVGGTSEYLALSFKRAGMEGGFFYYVAACILLSLTFYVTLPETRPTAAGAATTPGCDSEVRRGG